MKKFIILTLAGSLALWSCDKNVPENNPSDNTEANKVQVDFFASAPATKAVFGVKDGSSYPVKWSSNDVAPAVALFQSGVTDFDQATDFVVSADGTTANFKAAVPDAQSSYTFISVSPYSALRSVNGNDQKVNVEIPSGQTSGSGTPDEKAIVLYAKTGPYNSVPYSVDLSFDHVTAYLNIAFTNLNLGSGETVQSVDINSDLKIAGRTFFFPEDGHIENNAMTSTITVNTDDPSSVWAGIAPVDLSGQTVTFIVKTNSHTFTKAVTFGTGRALTSGKVAKFTVDMNGIAGQEPEEFVLVTDENQLSVNDEIIIVGANYESALSTTQNANNRAPAAVTKDGNKILSPSNAVQRITLVDGIVPGEYALKVSDNKYLYYASGGNYLRTKGSIDATSSWDINIRTADTPSTHSELNTANVAYIQEKTHARFIRYNYSDDNNLFSTYAESSGTKFVSIYRKVKDDVTPSFNVTNTSLDLSDVSVPATGQTVKVYVFGNVAWTASVTTGATLNQNSGTGSAILEVTIPANDSDVKTYTVTVSTTASVATQSYSLKINQAASGTVEPEVVYSIIPNRTANNNYGSNGSYNGNCDMTIDGIMWNVTGVTDSDAYDGWRLGGKSLTGVDRAIYSKTAIPNNVTKIVVEHTGKNITVNSFTLTVHTSASDAASGDNAIATLTGSVSTTAATEFVKQDNTEWKGCFYRLVYNVTETSGSNKYVQMKSLNIWGYPTE